MIFLIFFRRDNKCLLKNCEQHRLVHIFMYLYNFFYLEIFQNSGTPAVFQERLFLSISCGGHDNSRTVHLKSEFEKDFISILHWLGPGRRICKNFDLKKNDNFNKKTHFLKCQIFGFFVTKIFFFNKI